MRSHRIGDLGVSALAVGGLPWGLGDVSDAQAREIVDEAIAVGVTLFDTSRVYSRRGAPNSSEELLARLLRERPDAPAVISTRGGHYRDGDSFPIDGRPQTIIRHCEDSLRIFGRECLDVYSLHLPDPRVPLAETMGVFAELRAAGKIRHAGLSCTSLGEFDEARSAVEVSVVTVGYAPSALPAPDLVAELRATGVPILAAHAIRSPDPDLPAAFARVAHERGVAVVQILAAWYAAADPPVIPVVEAPDRALVTASAEGAALALEPDELGLLDRAARMA